MSPSLSRCAHPGTSTSTSFIPRESWLGLERDAGAPVGEAQRGSRLRTVPVFCPRPSPSRASALFRGADRLADRGDRGFERVRLSMALPPPRMGRRGRLLVGSGGRVPGARAGYGVPPVCSRARHSAVSWRKPVLGGHSAVSLLRQASFGATAARLVCGARPVAGSAGGLVGQPGDRRTLLRRGGQRVDGAVGRALPDP